MIRKMNRIAMSLLLSFLGIVMAGKEALSAQSPEEFYQGKTVVILSSDPGGPGDMIARTIAQFLGKEIGASVKIENKKTDEVMNYLYKQGERGSLMLAIKASDGIIGNEILKAPGVQYETDKFNFLADVYPADKVFQLSSKITHKTLGALRGAKGLRAGGTSVKGAMAMTGAVMIELLGLDGKVISGFKGKKQLILAMGRGEVDFVVTTDNTAMSDEKEGYVINLMVLSDKRSVVIPHVPAMSELGVKVPKDKEAIFKFINSSGMAVAMSPGVPQDRVGYLRAAFLKLSKNQELRKTVAKLTGAGKDFVPGKVVQEEMAEIKSDKELAVKLDGLFKKHTAVR